MPPIALDYSRCCFYRLVSLDPTITETYVGHTTNAVRRKQKHKNSCTDVNDRGHNYKVYKFIRAHGGWSAWEMQVFEHLAVADVVAARLREQFWTKHYNAQLNSNVPGRTGEQYYRDHHTRLRENQNAYQLKRGLSKHHDCRCGGRYTGINQFKHERTHMHIIWITNNA